MDTNRREYDNIYIKTKLCIYIFLYIYTVYFLFIYFNNIENYER